MALALVQGAGSISRTVSGSPGGARRAAGNSPPLAPGGPAWPGMLGVEIMAPARDRDGGYAAACSRIDSRFIMIRADVLSCRFVAAGMFLLSFKARRSLLSACPI